jgi:23S rRNA (guanosine2251-2'-O)-methyltransferase
VQRDLQARPRLAALVALARERGVGVSFVSATELDQLAGSERHQGIAAEALPFQYRSLGELLDARPAHDPLYLVLDGVEDPHNFGAILRSADATAVDGVVVAERRAAPVTPVVARASAGALDHVAVAQVVNLSRALEELKTRGIWIYGLDVDGDVVFDEADYARPLAIVAGAEGKGLSRLVRDACDVRLRIPLYGHVASLNVSVATALALFAARRSRDRAASRG